MAARCSPKWFKKNEFSMANTSIYSRASHFPNIFFRETEIDKASFELFTLELSSLEPCLMWTFPHLNLQSNELWTLELWYDWTCFTWTFLQLNLFTFELLYSWTFFSWTFVHMNFDRIELFTVELSTDDLGYFWTFSSISPYWSSLWTWSLARV